MKECGSMLEQKLRAEGFAALPNPTMPSGVYALLRGREVLYIGVSKAIYGRIAEHNRARKKNRIYIGKTEGDILQQAVPFDRVLAKFMPHHDAKILESELIHRYQPPYNKKVIEPIRDYGIDLDALAEAAGISWSKEQEPRERTRNQPSMAWRRSLVS